MDIAEEVASGRKERNRFNDFDSASGSLATALSNLKKSTLERTAIINS
jgi:hypothetical protein